MLLFKLTKLQLFHCCLVAVEFSLVEGFACGKYEFQCLNVSQCIHYKKFCDGTQDCIDGSDEYRYQKPPYNTTVEGIPCRQLYYTCVLPTHMTSRKELICSKGLNCVSGEFRCKDGSGCLPPSWFCGGINDCADGSDENQYVSEKPSDRDKTLHNGCFLEHEIVCDGVPNFKNGIDECLCPRYPAKYSDARCFRCLMHSRTVLTLGKLCDGVIDCPDLSDECMCGSERNIEICRNITWDLENGGTRMKHRLACLDSGSRKKTIEISQICDGKFDCADGIDEENCSNDCESEVGRHANKHCGRYSCGIFGKRATSCDGIPTCASDMMGEECSSNCSDKLRLCNFVEEMPGKTSWTRVRCNVTGTSLKYLDGVQLCDGNKDCSDGEDEIDCPHRFYCQSGNQYSIVEDKFCDQERDCEDGSDEPANCSLHCNDDGDIEFVSRIQVCDGTKNCKSGIDECEPGCVDTAFSDNNSLISNKVMLGLVSIISFLALAGNITVISQMIWSYLKSEIRSEAEKLIKVFVFALSCADLIVGIFTSAICLQAISSSTQYCLEDRFWRSSATCSALGVLVVIGSQQSVFTMVLITAFRVHAVSMMHSKYHSNRYIFALVVTWIISILLGVIPEFGTLEDYSVDTISYDGNKLFATINSSEKTTLTNWLLLMYNKTDERLKDFGEIGSWSLLKHLIAEVNPNYTSLRKFGFYSSHSVCLPTLFPDVKADTAWIYSLFLIVINFVAFFCIFTGGIIISRKTLPNVATDKGDGSQRAAKLRRNLTRIVVTDFCCWMPVCIMAFLQVSGVDIPHDAYIPVGLLIIPINSALNPFLYSNIPDIIWEKIKAARAYVSENALRVRGKPPVSRASTTSCEQTGVNLATIRSADDEVQLESRTAKEGYQKAKKRASNRDD